MKSEKRILIAFVLNLFFSIIELIGGTITGSVAVVSDSVHDLGDSLSIGISFILEKISKKESDSKHTYGYLRYSLLGGLITSAVLLVGSVLVIYNAINRILNPVKINYDGMLILSVFGAAINIAAAYFTKEGESLNQKAVSLHMLEDMLGWIVVFAGAIIMKFTDITYIDPILSIGVAIFILINALKNIKFVLDVFLEKTPEDTDIDELYEHLKEIESVIDVHDLKIRSLDGYNHFATVHVVTDGNQSDVKNEVKKELANHGITQATVETELPNEQCIQFYSNKETVKSHHHHHHHH